MGWARAFHRAIRAKAVYMSESERQRAKTFLRDARTARNRMIVDQVTRRLGLEPTKRLPNEMSNEISVDLLRREVWAVGNLGSDATWSRSWLLDKNSSGIAQLPPTPSEASTSTSTVALVVPFCDGDLIKLETFLGKWNLDESHTLDRLRCVLAYCGDLATSSGSAVERYLVKLWQKHRVPLQAYTLSLKQPPVGHYDGAAMSFFSMFRTLRLYFVSFQIMETDTIPVAGGWAERLASEATNGVCTNWWQKGSAQRCNPYLYGSDLRQPVDIDWNHDFHMNGNALCARL